MNDADQSTTAGHAVFKPCIGFRLRPSLGSAFKPISNPSSQSPSHTQDEENRDHSHLRGGDAPQTATTGASNTTD